MVFGDFLNQKVRLAPSLFKVTVDRASGVDYPPHRSTIPACPGR